MIQNQLKEINQIKQQEKNELKIKEVGDLNQQQKGSMIKKSIMSFHSSKKSIEINNNNFSPTKLNQIVPSTESPMDRESSPFIQGSQSIPS